MWGTRAWSNWQQLLIEQLNDADATGLFESDLTSYFDCIRHDVLMEDLASLGVGAEVTSLLRAMLKKWSGCRHLGLPQGIDASRILGNFYLQPVDRFMLQRGWKYSRFMDDIRIVVSSDETPRNAAADLQEACRLRGLILNGAKTAVTSADEARDKLEERKDFSFADYLLESNSPSGARHQLRSIFRGALSAEPLDRRGAKFSLFRLGKLRDKNVLSDVLTQLPKLGPLADVAATYLQKFADDGEVEPAILKFLATDPSPYVATWMLAVLNARQAVSSDCAFEASRWARDRNRPSYVRAMATMVMVRSVPVNDLREAKHWVRSESDHTVVRAFVFGLASVGRLDKDAQKLLTDSGAEDAVAFAIGRETFRSCLDPNGRIPATG